MKNIYHRVLSRFQPFRVCMWHTGRCGSSVVADLVSRDGRILWAGEVLERVSREWKNLKLYHDDAALLCRRKIERRMHEAGRSPFGFEMKLWHHHRFGLTAEDMHGIVTGLGFGRHVVLERKNYLRQHVSGELGKLTGRWHRREGDRVSAATLRVEVNDLIAGFERYEAYHRDLRTMLPGCLYLTYEDDIKSDPTVAYAKVMEHVGLEPRSVATDMRKTNPRRLADVVENYEDLAERLSGTRYEWMLKA